MGGFLVEIYFKQESIPVGCVRTAFVVRGGGGVDGVMAQGDIYPAGMIPGGRVPLQCEQNDRQV